MEHFLICQLTCTLTTKRTGEKNHSKEGETVLFLVSVGAFPSSKHFMWEDLKRCYPAISSNTNWATHNQQHDASDYHKLGDAFMRPLGPNSLKIKWLISLLLQHPKPPELLSTFKQKRKKGGGGGGRK